jgi:hypothetical protein
MARRSFPTLCLMIQSRFWFVAVALQTLALSGCLRTNADEFDELSSKRDYSVLQYFEYEWRGKTIAEPRFEKLEDAEVLGLPALDGHGTVWILLKPSGSPFYKQSIDANYVVPKSMVERLVTQGRVSPTVAAALLSHTAPQ